MKLAILRSLSLAVFMTVAAFSQDTPDMAKGLSPNAEYVVNGIDNYNPANGNIFLRLPLLSYPQKGGKLHLDFYIYYNDKQWNVISQQALYYTAPLTINQGGYWDIQSPTISWGDGQGTSGTVSSFQIPYIGAYVAPGMDLVPGEDTANWTDLYTPDQWQRIMVTSDLNSFFVLTPDGSKHYIGEQFDTSCRTSGGGTCPTFNGNSSTYLTNYYSASDATGYTPAGGGTLDSAGNLFTYDASKNETIKDPNGNTISLTQGGWTDTFNRTIPGSSSGTGTVAFPNDYNGPVHLGSGPGIVPGVAVSVSSSPCPSGTTGARKLAVPASQSLANGTAIYYLCYSQFTYSTNFATGTVYPPATQGSGNNTAINTCNTTEASSSSSYGRGPATLLSAVMLPEDASNSTYVSYSFSYDQYLSLSSLGLPTGGEITYEWQNVPFNSCQITTPISRALKTRTVIPGAGQPSITTTYRWPMNEPVDASWSPTFPIYSIATDSNGNDTEYKLDSYYVLGETDYYTGCGPHDTASDRTCSPSSGTLLRSVAYVHQEYQSGGAAVGTGGFPAYMGGPSSLPSHVQQSTTTEYNSGHGTAAATTTGYAPGYGQCTQYSYPVFQPGGRYSTLPYDGSAASSWSATTIQNCYNSNQVSDHQWFDFGSVGTGNPGPLLREVKTAYEWQSNSNYLTANLLDLVSSETTYDGSGVWAGEADYGYDESPSPSGAHGNLTSTKRYVSQTQSVTSATQFNASGIITLKTDPLGNKTQFSNLTCNGALPQTVIAAYGSSTTLPETTTYGYDCNTGKVTTVSNLNTTTQVTTYTYDDPRNRVTTAAYPDGGSASVDYHPGAVPPELTVTTQTGGPQGSEKIVKLYDGLARKTQTQRQTSSSGAEVYQTTNYDNMGRVLASSNPFDPTAANSSDGWTTFAYDALDRPQYTCNPDNGTSSNGPCTPGSSYRKWTYSANTTTSFDENGHSWQRIVDGLGRLTQVIEPGNLYTEYQYDALGNLKCAVQLGTTSSGFTNCTSSPAAWRPRSFSYDGLSRLGSATNPETDAIGYTYDNDGNVHTRTDARGIITTYTYDALNRLTSKTYSSNDSSKTPISCFQYDTSSISGAGGNLVGRLTNEWTQPSGTSCSLSGTSYAPISGSYLSLKSILAYDPMGRPTSIQQQQCVGSKCSAPTPYALTLGYDQAGNLNQLTNSVGAQGALLTLTNYYDTAGRACLTTSTWGGSFPTNLFQSNPTTSGSSAGYSPAGLQNWALGSSSSTTSTSCAANPTSPVNLVQGYTNRLRVSSISATGQIP